jgi:hypothetical protein
MISSAIWARRAVLRFHVQRHGEMDGGRFRAIGEQGAKVAPARLGDGLQRAFFVALRLPAAFFQRLFDPLQRIDHVEFIAGQADTHLRSPRTQWVSGQDSPLCAIPTHGPCIRPSAARSMLLQQLRE